MNESTHDKNRYHFIEPCFYVQACQWDIVLVQVGMRSIVQASMIDYAGNITNLTENCASKSLFFFSQGSKETCSLIFVSVIKKVHQENIPFVKVIHIMYVFITGIIGKTNCYWHVRFFFYLHSVGKYKKQNKLGHVLYLLLIKSEEKKFKRPLLNYQGK